MSVALPAGIDPEDSSESFATGHIISQFTVTRRGKLREIGLLEISPERDERIEAEVKHALNRFVYRPRFERGTAVDTSGQLIRYEYPIVEALTAAD